MVLKEIVDRVRKEIDDFERQSTAYQRLEVWLDGADSCDFGVRLLERTVENLSLVGRLKSHTVTLMGNVEECIREIVEGVMFLLLLPLTIIMYLVLIPREVWGWVRDRWYVYIYKKYFRERYVKKEIDSG